MELETAAERWLGIMGTGISIVSGSIFVSFVTNTMANVARERMRTTKILQSVRKSRGKRSHSHVGWKRPSILGEDHGNYHTYIQYITYNI